MAVNLRKPVSLRKHTDAGHRINTRKGTPVNTRKA